MTGSQSCATGHWFTHAGSCLRCGDHACGAAPVAPVIPGAADIAGKWTAELESPIGVQKYVYEFKVDGATVTIVPAKNAVIRPVIAMPRNASGVKIG